MTKSPKAYKSLADEFWQRDLALLLPEGCSFNFWGKLVLSGLFGISRGKDVPGQLEFTQLRFICNLVPSNGCCREIKGDIAHIPYMFQWASFMLFEDEVILVFQVDLTCAFCFLCHGPGIGTWRSACPSNCAS